MSKKKKQGSKLDAIHSSKNNRFTKSPNHNQNSNFLYSMSMAPRIEDDVHWFQLIPATIFTAFIIMIVRMYQYQRPMNQFYWTNIGNDLVDFFSHYKMVAIIICAVMSLLILLYRLFSQSFFIKRTHYYIPMIVYSAFVLLSFGMSDYKDFALLGWNDRFEGTVTLLAYMIMLFYIINTINTEHSVKWIIYPAAVTSMLLSFLGLSQALNHDFFRTTLGKKMITPSWFWNNLDELTFTFKNKEIYQTVYNINYVSFYLTLLIPLFGLLFIHSIMNGNKEPLWKKILWGMLFTLNMYNLIGSQSSGGFLGMAVIVLIALIVLNKTIIKWWKPVIILLVITILVGGITYERWMPEISGATHSVLGLENTVTQQVPGKPDNNTSEAVQTNAKGHIDYIETKNNDIVISYEGNEITFTTYPDDPSSIKIVDSSGKDLNIIETQKNPISLKIDDERFNTFNLSPAQDSAGNRYYIIQIDGIDWPFTLMPNKQVLYRNALGKMTSLEKIESIGWKDNQGFGSGRGYIWSRTLPMMKDTMLIGHGPDTYCLYFPQNDYVGRYNADWDNINMIIDKPHNMYMGAWVGTGGISVLALLGLWLMYIIQSIKTFWNRNINSFTEYAGLGIFLGICGFLVSGLVDDSSVSVMPMFYGLLGTGIAINLMLLRKNATN